jgi:hypothetical protein
VAEVLQPVQRDLTVLREENRQMRARLDEVHGIAAAEFDNIPELHCKLLSARDDPDHRAVFKERNPLISIRIATHNRCDVLLGRTIPSVLAQTHENLEIIVVGDGCNDDTEAAIARLADPRVRFVALPQPGAYPTDPVKRWMVAGSPAMNLGARQAGGQWIAPLDDDDVFTPDHLRVLLDAALADGYEMVYGKFRCNLPAGTFDIGVYPPVRGQFGFQAGMYMTRLRFFEWEVRSWLLDEPADWNICRRMLEAGVRIGFVDAVVTEITPTGPRASV